jgi:aspartate racemase
MKNGIIGVVAGVGPWAGLDLTRKLLQESVAERDQDYPTIVSISEPSAIADRSEFLRGATKINPAVAITDQLLRLEQMGATVAGIPCNTAHAPAIFDVIRAGLESANAQIALLHMLEEVGHYLREVTPSIRRVGLLATVGTYQSGVYEIVLSSAELIVLNPPTDQQTIVHDAIYNPNDGIKATGHGNDRTLNALESVADSLREMGAEAVILGCTELPLAITTPTFAGLPTIDPTLILARALLREIVECE